MRYEDGKTEKTSRGLDSSYILDKRAGLGSVQTSSRNDGIKQIGSDQADCTREDSFRTVPQCGETPAGKILERLDFIEGAFVSYVKADQAQLESRLLESKGKEQQFRAVIKDLKEEIYSLVSEHEAQEK